MSKLTPTPQLRIEDFHKDHWTTEERANAALVLDFFQILMNDHDFDGTLTRHGDSPYVQHNRAIPDGIAGLVGYVKSLVRRFPDYAFDVKRVIASGDLVVLHSHATFKAAHRGNESKGFIITDTFRLEDGRLAEHWDAIQPIDFMTRLLILIIGGTTANNNPTFQV